MIKIKIFTSALFLVLATSFSYSQSEGDRIIAIIGNDIILESDLNYQILIYARQNNVTQLNERIIQEIFQNMVSEKLMLAKAEQDSIIVTEDEVHKQVDFRLQQLVEQFGSEKNLEQAYGITIGKIKSILKEDFKKKIKIDKLKDQKFGGRIKITRTEVINFYNEYKDSLPPIPETFELYQIVRTPGLSQEAKNSAYLRAKLILDSLKSGADFSELARRNSDDSASAVQGGDLGKVKKGVFVKEFEDAAFLLKQGEISDIVETQFGYHIIKVNEKTGDIIKVQHILIKFPHLESSDFEAINFLKDLKSKALNDESKFKELAVLYSDEKQSKTDSGYIGKINITQLDSLEVLALKDLKKNEISEPVRIGDDKNYSYYIYFLKDRFAEHRAALEEDYVLIERFAQNFKESKEINEWLEELKKTIYVEIKI
ncbi:MAG: foldase protein PrsA [Ignavibacteria bacterium]